MAVRQLKNKTSDLKLAHRHLLLLLLVLPLLLALLGFGLLQSKIPDWPTALAEKPRRGLIIAADGTIFAEGNIDTRRYPQGNLGAHLIGFSGAKQPDGRFGLEGVEYALDAQLQAGETVTITINPTLQAVAQAELRRSVERNEAENGAVVMIEAGTGRILAAASYPEYDPNKQGSVQNRSDIINRAFLQQVEPGSTFKPLVVAAALESGRILPDEIFEVEQTITVGEQTFRDVMAHEPLLSIADILKYSSNVGMIKISERFSPVELNDWLGAFGIGQDMNLRGSFTRSGQLNSWQNWVMQDQASISIGQSVSTTALQLAAAYSIFANDGVYIPPRLLEDAPWEGVRRIISPEVARAVRSMLVGVVNYGGARNALIPGVLVAGKTGTADIFDTTQGRYIDGDYTGSFAGIFPADNPRVTMVVYVQKSRGKYYYGSAVAAPVFRAVGSEAVALWGLAPQAGQFAKTP